MYKLVTRKTFIAALVAHAIGIVAVCLLMGLVIAIFVRCSNTGLADHTVPLPDLDTVEARLVSAVAAVNHWQEMAERHSTATAVTCEGLFFHKDKRRDVRNWPY